MGRKRSFHIYECNFIIVILQNQQTLLFNFLPLIQVVHFEISPINFIVIILVIVPELPLTEGVQEHGPTAQPGLNLAPNLNHEIPILREMINDYLRKFNRIIFYYIVKSIL